MTNNSRDNNTGDYRPFLLSRRAASGRDRAEDSGWRLCRRRGACRGAAPSRATPDSGTGGWVGKDRDESLGVNETGSRTAIPIWLQYMKNSLKGTPILNFPVSNEVTFVKINKETGYAANFGDTKAKFESFLKTNLPENPSQIEALASENTF